MNNLTTYTPTNQLLDHNEAHFMIDDLMNTNPGFCSEEEVKLLLEAGNARYGIGL